MWSLKSMYPTVPVLVPMVSTFCTGVEVTLAAIMVTVRGVAAPRSSIEKEWDPPGVDGNNPAFRVLTLVASVAFTRSTPSTVSTCAPRARSTDGAVAGEFGSVYATTTWRGGREATTTHCAP